MARNKLWMTARFTVISYAHRGKQLEGCGGAVTLPPARRGGGRYVWIFSTLTSLFWTFYRDFMGKSVWGGGWLYCPYTAPILRKGINSMFQKKINNEITT
jgi:hypothetical protein